MKLFSPRLWSIAWRVRLGLLVVPCLLAALAWYQYRVANETVERYRAIVENTDALLLSTATMRESAQAMENAARSLSAWMTSSGLSAGESEKTVAEKLYVAPYNAAKARFEQAFREASAPPASQLQKHLDEFHLAGMKWQRDVAEPLIRAMRDPQPLDTQNAFRPFEEAETAYTQTRDALLAYRGSALSGADRFRWFSTLNLLALSGAAIALAMFIGIKLSRAVTAPLEAMVAQSRRIERGDYSAAPLVSSDEFAEVTQALNAMTSSIAARLEQEKLTGRLTAAITRSLDPATVLETTARELGQALNAARCVLCVHDVHGEAPMNFGWQAPGIAPLNDLRSVPLSGEPNAPLALSDIENEGAYAELQAQGVRALLVIPLLLRGQSAGQISLHHCAAPHRWTMEEISLVEHAAAQLAVALDNARLLRESQQRAAELQAARDALAQSSARLQEKNKELEEFVYTVSHDLKAPLISIQGYLEALEQEFAASLPDEAKFYVQRVHANAAQLESLIGELIELSRIGRVGEAWSEVDTRHLAREAAAELTLQAQGKAVQIEIAPDLPVVCCVPKRVRQIFLNLLDNAIKYSDPTKPSRWVKVRCEDGGDLWRFIIEDNGLGIAPEHLEKAFGIFQRVGQNGASGSGIGLATVRRAAEAHGGSAWAASSGAKQGSTFYFSLRKEPEGNYEPTATPFDNRR